MFLRTTSASYNSFEVVTSFSYLKYSRLRRANRPLSCGMLRYKSKTPTVHKIISSGKFGKEWSFFKKSFVKEKNIFLSQIELKPYLWWRYIDEIFFLWENGEEKLREITEHFNEKYPTIKFTAEWSQTSINFLDVTVSLKGGKVTTDLYAKPTDTINVSTLLHVTHITAKRESHAAKLFVLIESVQILSLSMGDAMIWKKG